MTVGDYYQPSRPPLIERLARIEGQSNFLSLLAGIEAGQDTTEPMGALAFAKMGGAIPEVLEAHVARSRLFQAPIMSMVFAAIVHELNAEKKEWPWILGAVADAFIELRDGFRYVKPLADRAREFTVRVEVYAVVRKIAGKIMDDLLAFARARWHRAMRRETESPGIRHIPYVGERGADFRQGRGCYVTPPRTGPERDRHLTLAISGHTDRLGFDARQDRPGPVLTLYGEEAEEHRRKYPAHSKRPHSL